MHSNTSTAAVGDSRGWAIVGPGKIAHQFAGAVAALPHTHVRGVHGRNRANAQAFADHWTPKAAAPGDTVHVAADLDALLADPGVHAVYVATPHAQHGAAVRAALLAGKAVLCEKPLVAHLAEGEALVALARERGVFLMEALWTRFLPAYQVAGRWLREGAGPGVIGPVRAIQSSFCFNAPYDAAHRNFDPALAGGALLDLGVYNLAMTRWVLEPAPGQCPEPVHMQAHAVLAPTGVDQRLAAMLAFDGGVTSQFVCGFDAMGDNAMHIQGERGSIIFRRGFSYATEVVLNLPGHAPEAVAAPFRVNGFEYEVEEALRCMRAGLLESPQMPHAESLALLRWMDALRRQVGVRYPFE